MKLLNNDKVVLEIIREFPGISRAEITDLADSLSSGQVGWALIHLDQNGLIEKRMGPNKRPGNRPQVQNFFLKGEPQGETPLAELIELRAWKAQALARFPDLAVDEVVLDARRICARQFDGAKKEELLGGKRDDCPMMRAVVEALQEAA